MTRTRRLAWGSLSLLLSVLAACDDGGAPPTGADASLDVGSDVSRDAGTSDDAATDATDDAAPAADVPPAPIVWQRCYRSFFCADVSVPIDWSRPSGARATIGVLRAPARRPDDRLGVLMVNYGGPGVPTAVSVASRYPQVLGPSAGTAPADLFDIVAIDWRGLGRSQPSLACGIVLTHDPLSEVEGAVEPDADWARTVGEQMRIQRACTTAVPAEFLARVASDDAARDMDHVRAILGEERVNYVGYSYGTRLGASYMALFPQRVRAFVLDSPVAPDMDLRAFVLGQSRGFETALQRFCARCAADSGCPFRGVETTAEGVRRRYDALVATMDRTPFMVGKRRVTGFAAETALTVSSYQPVSGWPELAAALARAADGDASDLTRLVDRSWSDDELASGFTAILALDYAAAASETPDTFRAFLRAQVAPVGPHTVRSQVTTISLVGWPVRRPAPAASVRTPSAPPALIIGSRFDPPTPYEWATAMRDALGNGSHLVTYEGDGHANSATVSCLGTQVMGFLQQPEDPPAQATCPSVMP